MGFLQGFAGPTAFAFQPPTFGTQNLATASSGQLQSQPGFIQQTTINAPPSPMGSNPSALLVNLSGLTGDPHASAEAKDIFNR